MKETLIFENRTLEEAKEILQKIYDSDHTAAYYGNFIVNGDFVEGRMEKEKMREGYTIPFYKVTFTYDFRHLPSAGEALQEYIR